MADQLATSSAEGTFFAQQDPRAGLGCRPFHIKVLTSIEKSGLSCEEVFEQVKNVGNNFGPVCGQVLPVCTVSPDGVVSLKLSCTDCTTIGRYLSRLLPGADDRCSKYDDNIQVSIGKFMLPQTASFFESWLNSELSGNETLFPLFKAEVIELSEEFNNFTHYPVQLVGHGRRRSVVPLEESEGPSVPTNHHSTLLTSTSSSSSSSTSSSSSSSSSSSLPPPPTSSTSDSVSSSAQTAKDTPSDATTQYTTRLTDILVEKCKTLQGNARLGEISNAGQTIPVTPDNVDEWLYKFGIIHTVFLKVLKDIGGPALLQTLDACANPFGPTLSPTFQQMLSSNPGSVISIAQFKQLRMLVGIDSKSKLHTKELLEGQQVPLKAVAIPKGAVVGHVGSSSPVICYPIKLPADKLAELIGTSEYGKVNNNNNSNSNNNNNNNVNRVGNANASGNGNGNSNVARIQGAIVALNLDAEAFNSLGFKAITVEGHYYTLPIAWVGVVKSDTTKGNANATTHATTNANANLNMAQIVSGSLSSQPPLSSSSSSSTSTLHTANVNSDQPKGPKATTTTHSTHSSGENWTCPNPNCRATCFSHKNYCYKCHTPRSEQPTPTPRRPPITQSKPEGDTRDGDWTCTFCGGHNFASKWACFTCHVSKPGIKIEVEDPDAAPLQASKMKPGDWLCPKCQEVVFAKRSRCFRCSTIKPRPDNNNKQA